MSDGPLQQLFSQHPAKRKEPLPSAKPWLEAIEISSRELGLDPRIARALLFAESAGGYRTSSKGAKGPWQLTSSVPHIDPDDPEFATWGALTYYKQLLDRFKDPSRAAAAYNMGPTALAKGRPLPQETQRHLSRFLEHYNAQMAP